MIRKSDKTKEPSQVDAILTSDWHLRHDTPICRLDNFLETIKMKIEFVSDLQQKYGCRVIHAGDLFHKWNAPPMLITFAIENLPEIFYTAIGQHELPRHSYDLFGQSALCCLLAADRIAIDPKWGNWGKDPTNDDCFIGTHRRMTVMHRLVWKDKPPFPGCEGQSAIEALEEFPQYDLIVTGDNHTPFVEKYKGRLLVNPGSLTRQTADQIDHKPRVYLWDAYENEVTPVYIPINKASVTREHIDSKKDADEKIKAFVEWLTADTIVTELNFEENIRRFCAENGIKRSIREIIQRAMEEG